MDHEQAAVAVIRFVEAVGEAGVDRKIEVGIGIHQLGRNCIEPFWSLAVALIQLRPKIARPPTDRKGLEQLEMAGGVLLPDFELRLFLENAHKDRRMFWHLPLLQQREQLGRQLLCCEGRQLIAVFAKARDRRQCGDKSRRQHKRTDYRGADHCYTPPTWNLSYLKPVVGGFRKANPDQGSQMMPGYANKRSAAARCPAAHR